jgi:signal peptidase II
MRVLWVTVFIFLLDQTTKFLVKGIEIPFLGFQIRGLPLGSSRPIIGDLVRLTYIENPGMAFGIDPGGKLFFSLFTVAASLGIAIYLYRMRTEPLPLRFSLAMILGGACGNLVDRVFYGVLYGEGALFYGRVVDFIDIDFFNVSILGYHLSRWPVFNVADASVSVGVVLLLFVHRVVKEPSSGPLADVGSNQISGDPSILSDSEIDPPPSSQQ